MGKLKTAPVSFQLDGQFLGVILSRSGKIKGIRLKTVDGEQIVKLAKSLCSQISELASGDWIEVKGKQKWQQKTGTQKRKAEVLQVLNPKRPTDFFSSPPPQTHAKIKVLVCKKSSCMKRGGKALCEALESGLRDRALADQVTIQMTGCMKQCKAGPNVVFMPGKKVHRCVSPNDIPILLDQYCATERPSYFSNQKGDAAIAPPSYSLIP
jgi:(2Fe-2S) ferredoxin